MESIELKCVRRFKKASVALSAFLVTAGFARRFGWWRAPLALKGKINRSLCNGDILQRVVYAGESISRFICRWRILYRQTILWHSPELLIRPEPPHQLSTVEAWRAFVVLQVKPEPEAHSA